MSRSPNSRLEAVAGGRRGDIQKASIFYYFYHTFENFGSLFIDLGQYRKLLIKYVN